ncbi:MAG: hypothetical protein FJ095_15795 [Deltaproteobacteria bacterium]|nr:hypothetical protein [Deltaproteobacteria bacterium]
MTHGPFWVGLRRVALIVALGACAPSIDGQLDPKLAGEGLPDDEDAKPRRAADEPARTTTAAGPISRGDEEDVPEGGGASRGGPLLVTYPGVRMLDAGRTRVFVEISGKTEIRERKDGKTVTFHLDGVGVPEKVNRMPLPTIHFGSSVERVHLVQGDDGADLVIELRAKVAYGTKLRPSRNGTRLTIDFGKLPEVVEAKSSVQEAPPDSAFVQAPPGEDAGSSKTRTAKEKSEERRLAAEKKAEEKKLAEATRVADEKKVDEKKVDEKKVDEKKAGEKKVDEKKAGEKKADETSPKKDGAPAVDSSPPL